jgi:nucleoid DNA-binding protein
MWIKRRLALASLLGVTVALLGVAGIVHSQARKGESKGGADLEKQVTKKTRLKQETVALVLKSLGPAVVAEIRLGRQVVIPNLGVFRVVRVAAHRDLREGRPVTIAATNYVEFVPAAGVVEVANAQGTVPAAEVPAFEYHPRPYETPSTRVDKVRVPRIRSR